MLSGRKIGALLLIGSPILIIGYVLGLLYVTTLVLEVTGTTAVLGILGLLMWIGYTMFTEPRSIEPLASELDDLNPETIYPNGKQVFARSPKFSVIVDAEIGQGTVVRDHVNLFKCKIGRNCKIESFVYIEEGVRIGDNCKVKPHVYVPTGVTIEDNVFIGPNVTFTNDKYPEVKGEWKLLETIVQSEASIGANSVILPGVKIGRKAMIGAGSVVTKDVPEGATIYGSPAKASV